MLNFKNSFLWEFLRHAKKENPIAKFDRNFWKTKLLNKKNGKNAKQKKIKKNE